MIHIIFNPKASNGKGFDKINELTAGLDPYECSLHNVLEITDLPAFFCQLSEGDKVYLTGGDGTLNKFINLLGDTTIKNEVYLYGSGSGNDFLRDVLGENNHGPVQINRYIQNLPLVTVNGHTHRFIQEM